MTLIDSLIDRRFTRLFIDIFGEFYLLTFSQTADVGNTAYTVVQQLVRNLIDSQYQKLQFIIGSVTTAFSALPTTYEQLLKTRYIDVNDNGKGYIDSNVLPKPSHQLTHDDYAKLTTAVRKENIDDIRHQTHHLLAKSIDTQQTFLELILVGTHFLHDQEISLLSLFDHDYSRVQRLLTTQSNDDYLERIDSFFAKIIFKLKESDYSFSKNIVSLTKSIVDSQFYDGQLTVMSISKQLFVNNNYLSFQFKRQTGTSLNHYINDVRLTAAEKLVREGQHSLTEIAVLCGFNDALYFSKKFKSRFGTPPSQYKVK